MASSKTTTEKLRPELTVVDKKSIVQPFRLARTGEFIGSSLIYAELTGKPALTAAGWQYLYAIPYQDLWQWFGMLERMIERRAPESLVISAWAHDQRPMELRVALEPVIEKDVISGYVGMGILNRH